MVTKQLLLFCVGIHTVLADLWVTPGGPLLSRGDQLPGYSYYTDQGPGDLQYQADRELALLLQGSDKLGSSVSSQLEGVQGLAGAARAAAVAKAMDDNFQTLFQQGIYIISYIAYLSSALLGFTTAGAAGFLITQIGQQSSNIAYVYEGLIALVDVGEDCTVGQINTNNPDFRSDSLVRRPVEAYWVDVTNQIENIRLGLGCVDSSAIEKNLHLAAKAAKLRTELQKRIRKIQIEKAHV